MFMLRELRTSFLCTLVVPNEGILAGQARAAGIPVIILNIPLVVTLYTAQPQLYLDIEKSKQSEEWSMLVGLLLERRPDVALVNTSVHPLPAMAAKALGIPVVWAVMETIRETPYTSHSLSILNEYSDFLICISRSTAAPFHRLSLHNKISIIYPSWDAADYNPASWPESRMTRREQLGLGEEHRVVGFIASALYEGKGLDHYMHMAVQLAAVYPQAMFLIVGNPVDTPYFERCLDIARSRGCLERFRWVRFEENIEQIYPAMDIVVVPSLTIEGFGLTAMEGLIFGKAVVVYSSGGLQEIGTATGNEAYIAPAGDIAGLTAKAGSLLADERRLQLVSRHNQQAVVQAFGLSAYRTRLHQFLNSLTIQGFVPLRLVRGSIPTVYAFEDGVLHPFASEDAFLAQGHSFEEVRTLPDDILAALPKGAPIGEQTTPTLHAATREPRSSRRRTRRRRLRRRRLKSGTRASRRSRSRAKSGRRRSKPAASKARVGRSRAGARRGRAGRRTGRRKSIREGKRRIA